MQKTVGLMELQQQFEIIPFETFRRLQASQAMAFNEAMILANSPLPQPGPLEIKITISTTINLSAEEARRKVNRYVHQEVSYLMHGDAPNLMVADRVYWRVPILFTYPSHGILGTIGYIEVDVETGELNLTPQYITEMKQHAQNLADRATPETAPPG